jgi:hypothetical protein
MGTPKFIIWAPSFDEQSGGGIVLHLLCRRLNELGETALIWHPDRPPLTHRTWRDRLWAVRYELGNTKRAYRNTFGNPVARRRDLAGAIVLYPEIVAGNPLASRTVARWLLHRPGYHTGSIDYGPSDLFFFYQEAFDDAAVTHGRAERLTLTWFHDAYRCTNEGERSGSAYMLRKGKGRPIAHDLNDSILVDDLSHEEKAAVFNRVKYFYCYDLYTMYGLYAALCGCIPIIIPDPGLPKEAWTPSEQDRYGIAYGEGDVASAVATRPKLLERLHQVRAEEDAMTLRFVGRCRALHAGNSKTKG